MEQTAFVVFPQHAKFVFGEETFEQAADRRRRVALIALAIFLIAFIVFRPLQLSARDLATFDGLAAIIAAFYAIRAFSEARLYRRLATGQLIDASVVSSGLVQYRGSRGGLRLLYVSYALDTPTGVHIEQTEKVARNDAFGKPPEPGTPLMVCYVDDGFFRVM